MTPPLCPSLCGVRAASTDLRDVRPRVLVREGESNLRPQIGSQHDSCADSEETNGVQVASIFGLGGCGSWATMYGIDSNNGWH